MIVGAIFDDFRDDPLDVVSAVQLSRKVMNRIKLNLFWAFAYNTALIPVAAGILYPLWGIRMRPEFAAMAMALSSITVVSLSLLLKMYVPPVRRQEGEKDGDGPGMRNEGGRKKIGTGERVPG